MSEAKKELEDNRAKKRGERRADREKVKAAQRTTSDLVPEKTDTKTKKRKGLTDPSKKGSATKRFGHSFYFY